MVAKAQSVLERLTLPDVEPWAIQTSDRPTITVGTSATLTARIAGPQTGEVTEVGSRGSWLAAGPRLTVAGHSGLDFYYYGTACEIKFHCGTTDVVPVWVFIDGRPVTVSLDTASLGSLTSGTAYYAKLTWDTSRMRRVEFFCAHSGAWYDVRGSVGDTFMAAPRKPVVAWVGDSFWAGNNKAYKLECSNFIAARQLGVECVTYGDRNPTLAYGGAGYTVAGLEFSDTSKVAACGVIDPDLIVFQGSLNDDGAAGIQAAATATYAAYAAACPDTPMIVMGPEPTASTATISANRAANNAAVKAAAAASPYVIGFHDEIGHADALPSAHSTGATYTEGDRVTYLGSVWQWENGGTSGNTNYPGIQNRWALKTWVVFGSGSVQAPASDGNRDTLVYNDSSHPAPVAHELYGLTIARKIREDLANFVLNRTQNVD